MSAGEVQLRGTLKADGTLQLDETPNLSPGRVTVVLRHECEAEAAPSLSDEFFQMMEEIWAGQKARRFIPRAADEITAKRKQLQSDAEEEIEAAIRLQEESRRLRARAENERQPP